MFYQRNIQNPYPSDSQSYTAFKKGFELGWQSKQQPINPITIENFITMVKNSDAEIKKLVMDELGVEQKEPVDMPDDEILKLALKKYPAKSWTEYYRNIWIDGFKDALLQKKIK